VRSAKGDLEGALKDYDEAVRLAPGDALALNNRASARQAKGDAKGALEDYSEAIRLGYKVGRQFAARALPYEG
jgi:tetratricopeptide (TPR) repeat protein